MAGRKPIERVVHGAADDANSRGRETWRWSNILALGPGGWAFGEERRDAFVMGRSEGVTRFFHDRWKKSRLLLRASALASSLGLRLQVFLQEI